MSTDDNTPNDLEQLVQHAVDVVPADDTATDDDTPTDVPRSRLPEWVLDNVALLSLQCPNAAQIATMTGVNEGTVRALLDGSNAQFQAIRNGYRQKLLNGMIRDQMNLLDLLPLTYPLWKSIMTGDDKKHADEVARWVRGRLIPEPAQAATPAGVTVNIGANVQVESQLGGLLKSLPNQLEEIIRTTTHSTYDPDKFTRSDTEALPVAAVVPERE
jgi:hypothetical protein